MIDANPTEVLEIADGFGVYRKFAKVIGHNQTTANFDIALICPATDGDVFIYLERNTTYFPIGWLGSGNRLMLCPMSKELYESDSLLWLRTIIDAHWHTEQDHNGFRHFKEHHQ